MPTFAIGDTVEYCYNSTRERGTVTGILDGTIVGFTSSDNPYMRRAFLQETGERASLSHTIDGLRYDTPVGNSRLELVSQQFNVGDRVRYEWIPGSSVGCADGVITCILNDGNLVVTLDQDQRSRGDRLMLPDGTAPEDRPAAEYRWGNQGSRLVKLNPNRFNAGDRIVYVYSSYEVPGVVENADENFVGVLFDDDSRLPGDRRSFRQNGRYFTGTTLGGYYYGASASNARIEKVATPAFNEPLDPQFEIGKAARYLTASGESGLGEVTNIDDQFIYLTLDPDCDTLSNVHQQRVFRRDGSGTGPVNVPDGCRHTDRGGKLVIAPPKWQPTPGREYPEEPRIAYGIFDSYYGRPLQEGNPGGHQPVTGWGVINIAPTLNQSIYQTEEDAKARGYLARAYKKWRADCCKVDLDALDNPFDVLMGLEIYRAWVYSDQLGFEVYMPEAINPVRRRVGVQFNYERALLATGIKTQDEINEFFGDNAGSMRVTAVDGEKLTINDFEFAVVPRMIANFRPDLVANTEVAVQLLQNLAINPVARDSTEQLAA